MRSVDPTFDDDIGEDARSAARRDAFGRAQRHSARVRWLKFALPLAAVGLAGVFVYYSYWSQPVPAAVVQSETPVVADGKLVMANPKLEGFTKDGRPYSMTALRAVQAAADQSTIDLEQIDAKMPMEADNWARVQAKAGVYDRAANTLGLSTDILVTSTDGMIARLETAFIDIAGGTLVSDQPVRLEGKGSTIMADSMSLSDNGNLVVFEKRVRVTIDPAKTKASKQASGGTDASN